MGDALRIAVVCMPTGPRATGGFVFADTHAAGRERPVSTTLRPLLVLGLVASELHRDGALRDRMGDAPAASKERALGRFDKAPVAARKRVERISRRRGDGGTTALGGDGRRPSVAPPHQRTLRGIVATMLTIRNPRIEASTGRGPRRQ